MTEKVIGIDLGTGNSCVAVMEGGKPTVIANSEGSRTTPAVIYIDGETREVGGGAKRRMTMKPKNTISFIKRFMGANYDDADVQKMINIDSTCGIYGDTFEEAKSKYDKDLDIVANEMHDNVVKELSAKIMEVYKNAKTSDTL